MARAVRSFVRCSPDIYKGRTASTSSLPLGLQRFVPRKDPRDPRDPRSLAPHSSAARLDRARTLALVNLSSHDATSSERAAPCEPQSGTRISSLLHGKVYSAAEKRSALFLGTYSFGCTATSFVLRDRHH